MTDEMLPAYIAIIRRELKLAVGDDVLAVLQIRLAPTDPTEKLPARAPGIARLRRAARALEGGRCPDSTPEDFAGDLRFLQLFARDDDPLPRELMQKLLHDVMTATPTKKASRSRGSSPNADAKGTPFPEKGSAE